MQLTQTFSLGNVFVTFLIRQCLPAFAQPFGNLGVVHVRLDFANLTPLDLRPHHERVHRSLDVVRIVLLRLEFKK